MNQQPGEIKQLTYIINHWLRSKFQCFLGRSRFLLGQFPLLLVKKHHKINDINHQWVKSHKKNFYCWWLNWSNSSKITRFDVLFFCRWTFHHLAQLRRNRRLCVDSGRHSVGQHLSGSWWTPRRVTNHARDPRICICIIMSACVCNIYIYVYIYMYVWMHACMYELCMCMCVHGFIYWV